MNSCHSCDIRSRAIMTCSFKWKCTTQIQTHIHTHTHTKHLNYGLFDSQMEWRIPVILCSSKTTVSNDTYTNSHQQINKTANQPTSQQKNLNQRYIVSDRHFILMLHPHIKLKSTANVALYKLFYGLNTTNDLCVFNRIGIKSLLSDFQFSIQRQRAKSNDSIVSLLIILNVSLCCDNMRGAELSRMTTYSLACQAIQYYINLFTKSAKAYSRIYSVVYYNNN